MSRPNREAAISAVADSPCLGSGSNAKAPVHRVHRTPLRGSWDRPCSLPVPGCRDLLGSDTSIHSIRGRQDARTYAPSISTGAMGVLRVSWFVSRSCAGSVRFAVDRLETPDWWLSAPTTPPQTCHIWTLCGCSGCMAMLRGYVSVKSQISGSNGPLARRT